MHCRAAKVDRIGLSFRESQPVRALALLSKRGELKVLFWSGYPKGMLLCSNLTMPSWRINSTAIADQKPDCKAQERICA